MASITEVKSAFEARHNAWSELNAVKAEIKGEPTAEQRAQLDKLTDQINYFEKVVNGGLTDLEKERTLDEARERIEALANAESRKRDTGDNGAAEFRSALMSLYTGARRSVTLGPGGDFANSETRDDVNLVRGTATDGAELVPVNLYNQLAEALIDYSGAVLEAGATVIRTSDHNSLRVPKLTSHSTITAKSEAATFDRSNPQFDEVELKAYKAGAIMPVTIELLQSSPFAVAAVLKNQAIAAMGGFVGDKLVAGNGTTEAEGILNFSSGHTNDHAGYIFYSDIIDLIHSVSRPYRRGSAFIVSDSAKKEFLLIGDDDAQGATPVHAGHPLWQPALTLGAPDRMLGYPVYDDPGMGDVAVTGEKPVAFGNFSRGVWVRFAGPLRLEYNDSIYWESDRVAWKVAQSFDAAIVDTAAVRLLTAA